MRFHIGPVPEDTGFDPDPSLWSPIREPKPWLLILIAAPIGIVLAAAVAGLWIIATPLEAINVRLSLFGFLLYIGGLAIVHELIHALAHPGFGFTSRSIIGVWPSHLAFYAGYMVFRGQATFLDFRTALISFKSGKICLIPDTRSKRRRNVNSQGHKETRNTSSIPYLVKMIFLI